MLIEKQLEALKQEITLMARKAEAIYEKALNALITRNEATIQGVLDMDIEINEMEVRMDSLCMRLLALSEPYGGDLRFVFSVMKTTRDLERIGDESKTIAKWARKMQGMAPAELIELGKKAGEALATAVDSLINLDLQQAERTNQLEIETDDMENKILDATPSLGVAFIAKAMERVGDLATNIAENVIFSVKAQDTRHGSVSNI